MGVNNALGSEFVFEGLAQAGRGGENDGGVVGIGQQGDAAKGGGWSAKEIDEEAPTSGVLVGEETDDLAGVEDLGDVGGGTFFCDDPLPGPFPGAHNVSVEEAIGQMAGDGIRGEPHDSQDVIGQLPVSVVPGEQDDRSALDEQVQGFAHVFEVNVLKGGVDLQQARCVEDLDDQHAEMSERIACSFFDPAFGDVWPICQAEVLDSPLAVAGIEEVDDIPDESSNGQGGVGGEHLQGHSDQTNG